MRAIIHIMVACVLIAGCGRTDQRTATAAYGVTDDAARQVRLPHAATRVVSLMPTVTDLIIAMGGAQRLIARTDYDVDPRITRLPSIGGGLSPSIEWIAARKPDLVISWPDNGARSLVSRLSDAGISVYAARTETIEDAFRTVSHLGVLLGDTMAADSLRRALRAGLDSVRAVVAGQPRVRVAYVLSVDPPTIAGPGTFIDELIDIAGGSNAFADIKQAWPQINLEEVVRRNPDVIVLARETNDDPQVLLERLPGWRDLRAVRAHHVYRVSPDYFNRSGPLMPRAARELAGFLAAAR